MSTKTHLTRQVEKIMDTSTGREATVILRIGSDVTGRRTPAVKKAVSLLQKAALGLSARELLPPKRRKTRRAKKPEAATPKSLAQQLKKDRLSLLVSATKTEPYRSARARGEQKPAMKGAASARQPKAFWSSQSIVMKVPRDEIATIPDEMPMVSDIYLNRKLLPPRYVETKRLPETIVENKASAWGLQAINALSTWGAYGVRGQGASVAVLDTGVDASHPDLAGKVSGWAEFDAAGNEVVGSQPHDTDEHGTHVAGTIVGGNASGDWIGAAPEASIFAALVLDGAIGGTDAQVLAGIDWAITRGVDVINMSLGGLTLGPEVPPMYTQAIINALLAGIPVVAAIGNEGSQTSGLPGNDLFALAVGATDPSDRVAGFSGGRTQIVTESAFIDPRFLPLPYSKPDLSAPGVAVKSSVPNGKWKHFNGTSMATPHVCGAVALLISALDLSSMEGVDRAFLLQNLLVGSVEELGESGQDHRFGFGRIDVLRAIGFGHESAF